MVESVTPAPSSVGGRVAPTIDGPDGTPDGRLGLGGACRRCRSGDRQTVEGHRGGCRHVEGVDPGRHGDGDHHVGRGQGRRRQTRPLGPHEQGDPAGPGPNRVSWSSCRRTVGRPTGRGASAQSTNPADRTPVKAVRPRVEPAKGRSKAPWPPRPGRTPVEGIRTGRVEQTAATPKAAALRNRAPMFSGSLRPSRTATSGNPLAAGAGRRRRAAPGRGGVGVGWPANHATTPRCSRNPTRRQSGHGARRTRAHRASGRHRPGRRPMSPGGRRPGGTGTTQVAVEQLAIRTNQ